MEVVDDDLGTLLGEAAGDGRAQPAGSAGNKSDLALQPVHVDPVPDGVGASPIRVGLAGSACQAVRHRHHDNPKAVPMPTMLPLSGLRVIAVEQYGAGPFGSMMLGDLGAEVIKIENPADGGDVSRSVGPHFFADGDSHFFQAFNRNKKSVTLNLKHPRAKDVLHRLVRSADA